MFGPVTISMRRAASSARSLGTNGVLDEVLDHRMAAAAISSTRLGDELRLASSRAARARSASAASAIELGQRGGRVPAARRAGR